MLSKGKGPHRRKALALEEVWCAKALAPLIVFCIGVGIALPPMCSGQAVDKGNATVDVTHGAHEKLPEFEVATIKPLDPNAHHTVGVQVFPSGRVIINGVNLKALVMIAFNLSYWQIEGGDAWTGKDSYNIQAKAPELSGSAEYDARHSLFGIDDKRLREMLQELLNERFQLKFHRENRKGTVYLLERSGKPLKLQPVKANSGNLNPERDNYGDIGWAEGWVLQNITMLQLARHASSYYLHRPVLDRTGLTGAFNYRSPHEDPDPQSVEPPNSFVNMIQDLGLKLSRSEGPVETLVIDHADQPSPN